MKLSSNFLVQYLDGVYIIITGTLSDLRARLNKNLVNKKLSNDKSALEQSSCGDRDERVNQTISECSKQAQKGYKSRYVWVERGFTEDCARDWNLINCIGKNQNLSCKMKCIKKYHLVDCAEQSISLGESYQCDFKISPKRDRKNISSLRSLTVGLGWRPDEGL